jgi:cobalt-zinc-cadmium resistance protein CzcA
VFPDLTLGYFNQTLTGWQQVNGSDVFFGPDKRFQGFQFGLSVPFVYAGYRAKIKEAEIEKDISEQNALAYQSRVNSEMSQAILRYIKAKNTLEYYRNHALPLSEAIREKNEISFSSGEISYREYLLNLSETIAHYDDYLLTVKEYNSSIAQIEFLSGQNF